MDRTPTIRFALDEGAYQPERAHDTDAGADLRTPVGFTLPPHGSVTIDTGVHVELPPFTAGLLVPKSGLNIRCDAVDWGLIDEGYSGSIAVKLYNLGRHARYFDKGDKIAQLVVTLVAYPHYVQADEVTGGERGTDGFGSTGR